MQSYTSIYGSWRNTAYSNYWNKLRFDNWIYVYFAYFSDFVAERIFPNWFFIRTIPNPKFQESSQKAI